MKLDEMARDGADALHVSVAHLQAPPIDEKPRFGRVGVAALVRVAVVLLIVAIGVGWWATRDTADEVSLGSGELVDIPRLGVLSPQWRATVPVELPVPAQLAARLPGSLRGVGEGFVVVYENTAGSGAFLTLTTGRGELDAQRAATEKAGATTSVVEVSGADGYEAIVDTRADEADVRIVGWAPTDGVVATLTLTGFDIAEVDLVAMAESATALDDQTWIALQEATGWAGVLRSATGDYDIEPIDADALDLSDLLPPVQLVAALSGLDVDSIDATTVTSPEAIWATLAGGETLPLTADGRSYTWSSGSLRVLLAITPDETAARAADETIGGLGEGEAGGPAVAETPLSAASVYRSADRLLVHIEITGWPDDGAQESARAVAAAILDSAAHLTGS